jgi:hypothetical protein
MSCKRLLEMLTRHQRRLSGKGSLTGDTTNMEILPEFSLLDVLHATSDEGNKARNVWKENLAVILSLDS